MITVEIESTGEVVKVSSLNDIDYNTIYKNGGDYGILGIEKVDENGIDYRVRFGDWLD